MAADAVMGFSFTTSKDLSMRFPFQKIIRKRGFRRFIVPFSLALAVVFIGLANAAA